MVNRGEEKVKVHMNVVLRSTGNTNDETENQESLTPNIENRWTGSKNRKP